MMFDLSDSGTVFVLILALAGLVTGWHVVTDQFNMPQFQNGRLVRK